MDRISWAQDCAALLEIPSLDRVRVAHARARGDRLRDALARATSLMQAQLAGLGGAPSAPPIDDVSAIAAHATRDDAWCPPPTAGWQLEGVRSWAGSRGVHYALRDGAAYVVKAPADPDAEVEAARLARQLGLPAPAVERLPGGAIVDLPGPLADGALLAFERVEGADWTMARWCAPPAPDDDALRTLGRIAAFDLLTGNADRFGSCNRGNLMHDGEGTIWMIDNECPLTANPSELVLQLRPLFEGDEPGSAGRELSRSVERFAGQTLTGEQHARVEGGARSLVRDVLRNARGEWVDRQVPAMARAVRDWLPAACARY